mgnify:CR=1 FL=1
MLMLTRKAGEKIVIEKNGERIEIVVTVAKGGRARIGLDAPDEYKISRAKPE